MSADLFTIASAFLMHTGARHMTFDLTSAQKELLAHPITKFVILCAMFYMSTRSIGWSVTLILIYYLVLNMFLNEKHPLNVFSPSWLITNGYVEHISSDQTYTEMYKKNVNALSAIS